MTIFWEIHSNLPREGPGDNESTRKAFEMISGSGCELNILDMGCGPGMQTLELANLTKGKITAIDNHQPFLETLQERAQEAGIHERIEVINQSMFALSLPENSYDVIWSEGAIYIIGFERGLREWRKFLKPYGYIVVSECCWLKSDPPDDLKAFWDDGYPDMGTIEQNRRRICNCDFNEIGYFVLPVAAWWRYYYNPLAKRLRILRNKYKNNLEAQRELESEIEEIDLFQRYHDYYGYVFFVMQKAY